MERALELELLFVDALRPRTLFLAAKDPTLVVFGFNDEEAEA